MIPSLGPAWMDPQWLLEQFGDDLFWVGVAIVFTESGLLFPILPGDSLVFSIGLYVSRGDIELNLGLAVGLLSLAAFVGNVTGYEIGRAIGPRLYEREGRFVKRKHYDRTHEFFERYGAKALVLGRFVPVVRTFVTVVAGVSRMDRRHFLTWSAVGAVLWASALALLGYALGGVDAIRENLTTAILVVVVISVLPMLVEYARHRRGRAAPTAAAVTARLAESEAADQDHER